MEPNSCGCRIQHDGHGTGLLQAIAFCPTHAAALVMWETLLKIRGLVSNGHIDEFDREVICDMITEAVKGVSREV